MGYFIFRNETFHDKDIVEFELFDTNRQMLVESRGQICIEKGAVYILQNVMCGARPVAGIPTISGFGCSWSIGNLDSRTKWLYNFNDHTKLFRTDDYEIF